MGRLLVLFIVLPALELVLLIEIGARIGTLPTIALIVVTGLLGASLARMQGLGILHEIQHEVDQGRLPATALMDGVIVLLASALLITPGVVTDAAGFLCLVPGVRSLIRTAIWRRLENAVQEGRVVMAVHVDGVRRWEPPGPPGAIDVEVQERDPKA